MKTKSASGTSETFEAQAGLLPKSRLLSVILTESDANPNLALGSRLDANALSRRCAIPGKLPAIRKMQHFEFVGFSALFRTALPSVSADWTHRVVKAAKRSVKSQRAGFFS